MSVDFFSEALSRLKHELRVSKDGEVAALIGLGKTAFSERKKRGSFPDREVVALARNRPELGVDAAFVLTGVRSDVHAQLAQIRAASEMASRLPGSPEEKSAMAGMLLSGMSLASDEQILLDAYRAMDAAGKRSLLSAALGGPQHNSQLGSQSGVQQNNSGAGAIQIGAVGRPTPRRRGA